MKKIRFAIASVAAAGLLFASCSDDDNNATANIEGKWTLTKTITISNGNQYVVPYEGNQEGCDKDYSEFVDGGAYRFVVLFKNAQEVCTEDIVPSTWSKSGDQLTIVDTNSDSAIDSPPDAGVYEITKLTGSELRLYSDATVAGVDIEVTKVYRRL